MAPNKWAPYPKKKNGDKDTDKVREMFMDSKHIEWTKFAEENGWDPRRSRLEFPVGHWQDQKREEIALKEAESLSALLFDRKFQWHKDVLQTVSKYPKIADGIMFQIQRRLKHISNMPDEEFNYGTPYNKLTGERARPPVKNNDLARLATAYKEVSEAKYKTLLLSDWKIEKAEDDARPPEKDVTESGGIMFNLIGKGAMSMQDIQLAMDTYIDKPKYVEDDQIENPGLEGDDET